ncbi:hypothetical protein ABCR94_05290 [Streptomyces sp. 21So2-11]|uniref:hypothetical protein n=1 Tax=Streptomyces sp. 21So2-11 TaxID=3144408 RepID=UPI0032199B73
MATVSPPWTYTLRLPHDPRAPGIARSTLRAVLRTHGVGAGIPSPFNGSLPTLTMPGCLAESGRGLQIVRLCADSWGACLLGDGLPGSGGKLLWVECEQT